MHHKDGNVHNLSGTYEEVKPPEKLAFTWRWQQDETATESLVTVTFKDLGGSTEVNLTHKNLLTAESARSTTTAGSAASPNSKPISRDHQPVRGVAGP